MVSVVRRDTRRPKHDQMPNICDMRMCCIGGYTYYKMSALEMCDETYISKCYLFVTFEKFKLKEHRKAINSSPIHTDD